METLDLLSRPHRNSLFKNRGNKIQSISIYPISHNVNHVTDVMLMSACQKLLEYLDIYEHANCCCTDNVPMC